MPRVIVAALVAMVFSILVGPRFIAFLQRKEYGQQIREEGPQHHVAKQGTPTMGGLLIVISALAGYLALGHYTLYGVTVLVVMAACGLIGFMDDFLKIANARSLGLSGRWKLLLLAVITVGVGAVTHQQGRHHSLFVPIVQQRLPLWLFWYLLLFLIIAGAANGVNLTDGVDGLAAGTSIIALFTFLAINVIAYIRSAPATGPIPRDANKLDLAIAAAAIIGAAIGFLWFNAFPAEVFMGDTGSMALGGALGAFAIMSKTEFLLIFIGGIFVIEAVSVILQVASFKYWGRRIFLMAPIHHHFEMKAWSDAKIMVRFWIVTAILCASGFALWYRYYFRH